MKIGKVPESVLKRSIIKQIKNKRGEVILGAGVGEDCAALKLQPGEIFVASTDPITGTAKDIGKLAIYITTNDLASSGAEPVAVMLTLMIPEYIMESDIKSIMQDIEHVCEELNVQTIGGHTEVTDAVTRPILSVTGIGKVQEDKLVKTSGALVGDDIVVTKWIGLEGTSIIAKENEDKLKERYPDSLINTAKEFDQYLSVLKEAVTSTKSGVHAMHDVTEGGIYGALWEMAEASGVGLQIELKKVPIRQETIEICEFFDLNPYKLISSGCMLIASDHGYDLVDRLEAEGIKATVIGKFTSGNDRVILNDGDTSFLEPPKTDELYRV